METKFQTSFIPKKPILAQQTVKVRGSVSVLMVIAVLAFILSLAGAGGMIFWEKMLHAQQVTLKNDLEARKQQFNPELIEFLKRKTLKIETAKRLLNSHMAVSDIFGIIGRLTIQNVRFKSFDFTAPATEKDEPKITMKGEGASFTAIAYQADVLGRDKILKNPILSELVLDGTGKVSFAFTGTISNSSILYTKSLRAPVEGEEVPEEEAALDAAEEEAPANNATSTSN
ncbi:MAG: hypothetical protein V4526_01590 [Patescibacteria group bacterium]